MALEFYKAPPAPPTPEGLAYEPLEKPLKGDLHAVISKEAKTQTALRAEGDALRKSGHSLDEDEAAIRDEFQRLADEGEGWPTVSFWGSKPARLRWPITTVAAEPRGEAVPSAPDPTALIVSLAHDELLERALEQVRAHHAALPTPNLAKAEKRSRLREIDRQLFASMRRMSEAFWALRADGRDVPLPTKIDPRALLGLSDDLPLPPAKR